MSQPPATPRPRLHRFVLRAAWIAWAFGMLVTAFGFTAPWLPAADIINGLRPLNALCAVALAVVAASLREGSLIRPTVSLALLQVGLLLLPWARAADTATNLPPALRLVTFDI